MSQAKGENGTGLLSKVVKFVRSPATGWAEHDPQDEARDSGYSKQALKEMIERKRRNDFVRKREFDMLRKLRRSEAMAGHDLAARPSFFQSSMPSRPDDRASTLKKIDEIEAQMSQQWWKTRTTESTRSSGFPMSAHVPPDARGRPAAPLPGATAGPAAGAMAHQVRWDSGPLPMVPAAGAARLDPVAPAPAAAPTPPAPSIPATVPMSAPAPLASASPHESLSHSSLFSASKAFAYDVEDLASDPEIEEAAIRFANGDDAGAESVLRRLLEAGGTREHHEEAWLTLFDFYRATGQQAAFDNAAVDFADRFGRSAPQWISLADAAAAQAGPRPAAPDAGAAAPVHWSCPSVLTVQGVATLQAVLGRAPQPWRLSWARLERLDEAAAEPLARLMAQWAGQPVEMHFIGAPVLDALLRSRAVSGDRSVPPVWWKLRLEALRLMHRPDEFELAALDYCVTYEVSPPSWESPRCRYRAQHADGSSGAEEGLQEPPALTDAPPSGFGESLLSRDAGIATAALAGSVRGDAAAALVRSGAGAAGAELLVVCCANLVRIDFSAAGALLNWATARQAEGLAVHFTDLHRLVASFFSVIGISAQARVSVRRD